MLLLNQISLVGVGVGLVPGLEIVIVKEAKLNSKCGVKDGVATSSSKMQCII